MFRGVYIQSSTFKEKSVLKVVNLFLSTVGSGVGTNFIWALWQLWQARNHIHLFIHFPGVEFCKCLHIKKNMGREVLETIFDNFNSHPLYGIECTRPSDHCS